MSAHKAELILSAFVQQLKNATVVSVVDSSIVRDRVDPASVTPDINIKMGADVVVDDSNMAFIDSELSVTVVITVKSSTGLSTELNEIRKQIHQAIYADLNLGLLYIIQTKHTDTTPPETSGEAENETAQQLVNYSVWYRHAISNPAN
jgi:hypothetical protein